MQSHRPWVQPQVAANRGQQEQPRPVRDFINHVHLADSFNFTIFIYLIIFLWLILWDGFAILYINFPRNIVLSISNYLLGKLLCKMFNGREEDPYQWFICIMQMSPPRGTTTLLPPLTVGYWCCLWKSMCLFLCFLYFYNRALQRSTATATATVQEKANKMRQFSLCFNMCLLRMLMSK